MFITYYFFFLYFDGTFVKIIAGQIIFVEVVYKCKMPLMSHILYSEDLRISGLDEGGSPTYKHRESRRAKEPGSLIFRLWQMSYFPFRFDRLLFHFEKISTGGSITFSESPISVSRFIGLPVLRSRSSTLLNSN